MRPWVFVGWLMTGAFATGEPPRPEVKKVGSTYEFRLGGDLVTRYHAKTGVAKPYLWPLNAPGNIGVTRDWPLREAPPGGSTNEPHQKSAWIGHDNVGVDTGERTTALSTNLTKGTAFGRKDSGTAR